jgi:hypothetical protein
MRASGKPLTSMYHKLGDDTAHGLVRVEVACIWNHPTSYSHFPQAIPGVIITKLATWVTAFCPQLYSRDICSETYLVKRQMHKTELDCQTSSRTASWISHANVQGTCNLRRFLAHAFHNTTGFSGSSFCWIIITKRIWSKISWREDNLTLSGSLFKYHADLTS